MPNIFSRVGTIIYEVSKLLSNVPNENITTIDKNLKKSILNLNGICEYCEINLASTTDHFHSLVKEKFPSQYCNDFFNHVPCCTACNSSKGGRTFDEWFIIKSPKNPFKNMNEDKKEKIKVKMMSYEAIFKKNHITKNFSNETIEKINALNNKINLYLKEIEADANDIKKEIIYTRVKEEATLIDALANMKISTTPTDSQITFSKKKIIIKYKKN
jgi:hypothetical protein